jgi:hypothetical protein
MDRPFLVHVLQIFKSHTILSVGNTWIIHDSSIIWSCSVLDSCGHDCLIMRFCRCALMHPPFILPWCEKMQVLVSVPPSYGSANCLVPVCVTSGFWIMNDFFRIPEFMIWFVWRTHWIFSFLILFWNKLVRHPFALTYQCKLWIPHKGEKRKESICIGFVLQVSASSETIHCFLFLRG